MKLIITKCGLVLCHDTNGRQLVSLQGMFQDIRDKIEKLPEECEWFCEESNKSVTKSEWLQIAGATQPNLPQKRLDSLYRFRV